MSVLGAGFRLLSRGWLRGVGAFLLGVMVVGGLETLNVAGTAFEVSSFFSF